MREENSVRLTFSQLSSKVFVPKDYEKTSRQPGQQRASGRNHRRPSTHEISNKLADCDPSSMSRNSEALAWPSHLLPGTTSSLDALQALSRAEQSIFTRDPAVAMPLLERAVSLDPKVVWALARLADIQAQNGDEDRAVENDRKACDLRDRASEFENYLISGEYPPLATYNSQKFHQELVSILTLGGLQGEGSEARSGLSNTSSAGRICTGC
jgi:hypothetical protein